MSDYYKKPTKSTRHANLDWINAVCALHDLHCNCDKPLQHTVVGIIEQESSLKFTPKDSEKIKQCLTSTEGPGDVVEEFGGEELEALFAADTGEDGDGTG